MSYSKNSSFLHQSTEDLTGCRFGKLYVIQFSEYRVLGNKRKRRYSYWKCLCDCGKTTFVLGKNLKDSSTKSCGCYNVESHTGTKENPLITTVDLKGKRFGKLLVIEFEGYDKGATWKCICDCKNIKVVKSHTLLTGMCKSCGCAIKDHMKKLALKRTRPRGVSALNQVFYRYRNAAKERNIEFNILMEDFIELIKSNCWYCGCSPSKLIGQHNSFNGTALHNGVDRIDSSKGYSKGNCVACCKNCNYAKNCMSIEEFKNWIEKVYKHMFKVE